MPKREILKTLSTMSEGTPEDLIPVIRQYLQSKSPKIWIEPGEERGQLFVSLIVGHKPYKQGFYAMLNSPPLIPCVLPWLFAVQVTLAHKGSEIAFQLLREDGRKLFADLYRMTIDRLQELGYVTVEVSESKKRHKPVSKDICERREKVKQLYLSGKYTIRKIGWEVNASEATVKRDIRWLREAEQLS